MKVFKMVECPFCGGRPQISTCVDYSVIFCGDCGIRSAENRTNNPTLIRITQLVDKWNTRDSNNSYLYMSEYYEYGDKQ
jgi:transcription elongation factor Elf1